MSGEKGRLCYQPGWSPEEKLGEGLVREGRMDPASPSSSPFGLSRSAGWSLSLLLPP